MTTRNGPLRVGIGGPVGSGKTALMEQLCRRLRDTHEIAAIMLEPVAGNMGCVPPKPGYLAALREITKRDGALLIFDEVITGFRLGLGGAGRLGLPGCPRRAS